MGWNHQLELLSIILTIFEAVAAQEEGAITVKEDVSRFNGGLSGGGFGCDILST